MPDNPVFKMGNPLWGGLQIGDPDPSARKCQDFGSEVCCICTAFYLAGYVNTVTPKNLLPALNANGGFVNGLVDYSKVAALYGQFHPGKQGFTILHGAYGRHRLALLQDANGVIYNPLTATQGMPEGWIALPYVKTFSIDPAG